MEIMAAAGLLGPIKADDRRVEGWRNMREYLKVFDDGAGKSARLKIFSSCREVIRCIPLLIHDKHNGEDCAGEPHDITHAPESLRYGLMSRQMISKEPTSAKGNYTKGELEDMKKENNLYIRRR
jgi:phage terminase large subunit